MKAAMGLIMGLFHNLHELKAIHSYVLKINIMLRLMSRLILCGKDMYKKIPATARLTGISR